MKAVAFRVDADERIGLGHVMRCLALARALAEKGVKAVFLSRLLPAAVDCRLRQVGASVVVLPGGTPDEDALHTLTSARAFNASWICVDHYDLGEQWERTVAAAGFPLAAIDDYGRSSHACTLLIDHNVGAQCSHYKTSLRRDTKLLVGPRYALLRPGFTRRPRTKRESGLRRLQISFGGSDPTGETEKAIEAIALAQLKHVQVDIIVGALNPRLAAIRRLAAELPQAVVHVDVERMSDMLRATDLVIGAAGVSLLERCALAVPSLVVITAENQQYSAEAAASLGAISLLGMHTSVNAKDIATELERLARSPGALAEMSRAAAQVCDGRGAARVATEMLLNSEAVR
ncbi:MAG: UDP-2,4-diacetamido-2,4,6-trideoxy-beta-L-altropyranose hydrolase [Sutterellaceae bacterium]|nr:UDP-2,4-diacetamido-2,4,6-trideoxy-beta-L-altropyranose hydrolase [Burkholderiaceae bacterium]MDW8430198.1 UDP-2,4-diacetamido-2,4,6-trideoxy-beta-L-altropyranose hydrolase [Sutterellaceae bacterium]